MTAGSDGARMLFLAGGGRRGTRLAQPAWSSDHRRGCSVRRRCWHGDPRWWAVRGDRAATVIYIATDDDRPCRHDDERSTAEDDGAAAQQHRTEADDAAAATDDGTAAATAGPAGSGPAGGRGTRG